MHPSVPSLPPAPILVPNANRFCPSPRKVRLIAPFRLCAQSSLPGTVPALPGTHVLPLTFAAGRIC